MPENELSFKEMCERFDVTPRTLRYYEYIELLSPRKVGRSRFYGPREVARMTLILRGRRFGFGLEDIRQWLMMYQEKGSDEQWATFIGLADRQLAVLEQQREEVETSISELKMRRNEVARSMGVDEV